MGAHWRVYFPLSMLHLGSLVGVRRRKTILACCLCSWSACSVCKASSKEHHTGKVAHLFVVDASSEGQRIRRAHNERRLDHSMDVEDVDGERAIQRCV